MNTKDYALYANGAEVAEGLAEWLDEQLDAFRSRYGRTMPGPGIVFAIESQEEPFPAAEDARKRDLERHLRPYGRTSTHRKVYYRESFALSHENAVSIGLLRGRHPRPAWICFFTTNSHLVGAFRKTADKSDQDFMDKARKKMKPQDRVGKASDRTMLLPMSALVRWKYCSSDIKLMHLHRREILFRALSEQSFEDEAIAPPSWPEQLAGRKLRVITKDFALYAANPKMADELHEWLMRELTQFRLKYDTKIQGPGLVLAIEPGEEPIDALEEWRKRNVRRERWINWSSPIRRQFFMSPLGRPYCLSSTEYFKESFSLSYDEAVESAIVDRTTQRPGWICLLTTNAHLLGAFDSTIKQRRRAAKPVRGNASLGTLMMFAGIRILFLPRYRTIDVELMQLQRKETLFHALLDASQMDLRRRTRARKELRATIDQGWKYRWVRRPID